MPSTFEPDFDRGDGILPAVVQDATSGRVLMLAFMNRESFRETVRTGRTVFFSRSRQSLWRKGEQSGHVQWVKSIHVDCDADAILLRVDQVGGAACHEGYESCFFREITSHGVVIRDQRLFDPADLYGTTPRDPGASGHDDGSASD